MVSMVSGRRRIAILFSLFALLAVQGCQGWRPARVLSEPYPNRVRVTFIESGTVLVDGAHVVGDTALVGWLPSLVPYSTPLGRIREVQEKYTRAGATVATIGAVVAGLYLVTVIAFVDAVNDIGR